MLSAEPRRPLRIAPARHPSDRDAAWPRDNLPAEVSSFIGREAALADVDELIDSHRLVTLSGPPGVGKTQLALRVAARLRDRFRDGVWLVELAALGEPGLVASTVASTLTLRTEDSRPPAEALSDALRGRQILLILDNCEHLADACATLAAALLRTCPELRVLATSREPLGTDGEVCWPVQPLGLPATLPSDPTVPGAEGASGSPTASTPGWIDAVLASEAGRLFVERSHAVRPSLALTPDAARAVTQICQKLDGIPLAIELAAAWTSALSPSEIADRLDDRLTLLASRGRTAVPRQRTLRESIDWSHALLSPAERVLLRRLSIFRGGFTLDAVERVASSEWGAGSLATPDSLLDLLASLVQKSLVVVEDRGGETRYRFLEMIREYAAERLREAGEEAELARRHRDWCVSLAERASAHLRDPEQAEWRARLELEHDNLRAALSRTIASDEAEPGLRICNALWIFWFERGYAGEGYARVSRVLALPSASARTPLRAAALFVAGKLATEGTDLTLALTHCQESLEIAREQNDAHTLHRTLTQLGHIERGRGQWLAARRYYEEALPLRRELGDPVSVAISLSSLGDVARALRDQELARTLYQESLELARQQDHPGEITTAQYELGQLAHEQGHDAEAAAWYAEALPVAHRIYHPRRIASLLEGFAALAARQQPERALRLAGAADALREAGGCRLPPSDRAALDRELAVARGSLGDDASTAAWSAGTTLLVEQAVTLALSPLSAGTGRVQSGPASRLTTRESEVTALVARGLTNREIAEALIVTEGTAANYVQRVLNKLGFNTRAQIAAWAVEHGLGPSHRLPG